MKRYIMILMCLLTLSCNDKLAELDIVEFGAALVDDGATPLMPLGYKSGKFEIKVISDGDFKAEITEGSDWLHFEGGAHTYSGNSDDGYLMVYHDPNRTILRTGKIILTRKHRKVEIEITQIGILSEDFSIEQQNLWIDAEGGFLSSKVLTLSGAEDILIQTEYVETGNGQWISQVRMENNYLKFNVAENLSAQMRHAVITVSKKGTSLSGKIQVGQAAAGAEYETVTIDELKSMLEAPGSISIDENLVLTDCIVLNDNLEGNGAENRNITSIVQDLEAADRTLYVSDFAGTTGLRIDFEKGSELFIKRYDHLEVNLTGAVLTRENNPDRYIVSGLLSTAVMKNEIGSKADLVIKSKRISQLEPSDVYTLVELTDCEIPIRKGPYIGIDLRNYSIVNKYPMVIRDIEGGTMHMVVNTTCTWHRDGNRMPQGSGSITGVIVHEHCDNFEWNPEKATELLLSGLGLDYVTDLGDIGLYQIRPVSRKEVALAENFDAGFSQLICEWRYIYAASTGNNLIPNYEAKSLVMYDEFNHPCAWMTLHKGTDGAQEISTKRDWTLLGPYKDGQITDLDKGNGVECEGRPNAIWWPKSTEKLGHTQARIDNECGSAWNALDWSAIDKYWQVKFSTIGLTADKNAPMSIQIGAVNGYGDRIGGPRYWKMVYCTSEDDEGAVIAEYTVPDFPQNGNKRVWHCPGHKYMSFTVPENMDVWGKDNVIIKMIPVSKAADNGESYNKGTIQPNVDNSINYFAVRCNRGVE